MAQTSLNSTGVASTGALSLQSNGTTEAIGISTGQVATLAQNPVLTSGTANGVGYLNGSKVLTTGSALTFDGNTLMGTSATSAANLVLNNTSGATQAYINFNSGATVINAIDRPNATNDFRFNANYGSIVWGIGSAGTASERARIDSSGNLLVGTTTTSGITSGSSDNAHAFISSEGNVNAQRNNGACAYFSKASGYTNGTMISFYATGSERGSITTSGTTVTYNTSSDYRLKNVIGAVSGSGERIDALEPIEYTWKVDGSHTRGFLAHKFQEVYAGSVTGTKDAVDEEGKPVYQAMQASSSEVIADLVAEIQSLRKRLAAAGI